MLEICVMLKAMESTAFSEIGKSRGQTGPRDKQSLGGGREWHSLYIYIYKRRKKQEEEDGWTYGCEERI